ncbi:tellurite resistance/C4-dicarboxylate transporter family protein [Streptomyces sp. NPDC057702]|uniref:tellurite resistance/C4-dicarboxylate transporter family protein n=1 Tax=unclassified Streptomyces TaxID=2593676 RepID=UPI0036CCADFF
MRWTQEVSGRVRALAPACFAPVMATGIVSRAVASGGARRLSWALLGIGLAGFAVLALALAWRLLAYREHVAADADAPARVFGFFTFVAGSEVLAARLAGAGARALALALYLVAVLAWGVLAARTARTLRRHPGAARLADGTWFLCAVGLQSVVVAGAALWSGPWARGVLLGCWVAGVALYGAVLGAVGWRLRRHPVAPAALTPAYWVAMGACAISVLAGAQVVGLGWSAGPRRALLATLLALWCWATLLLPVLVAAGYWRHCRHRVPVRYEPTQWCVVFPLGMYAAASRQLGGVAEVAALRPVAGVVTWLAVGAWLLVTLAMTGLPWRFIRRTPSVPTKSLGSGQNQF